jgi:predicted RNase H-like HicB family nuclease
MALRYYWAIVEKSTDGFYAFLPDLPGATAAGESVEEALRWLAEFAADHIRDSKERDGRNPPEATKLEDIAHDPEAPEYGRVLLPVELPAKAVKISVTVDEGVLARIDRAASEAGTNRSAFLTDSALRHLRELQPAGPDRTEPTGRSFSESPRAFSAEETVAVPAALFDFLVEQILRRRKR